MVVGPVTLLEQDLPSQCGEPDNETVVDVDSTTAEDTHAVVDAHQAPPAPKEVQANDAQDNSESSFSQDVISVLEEGSTLDSTAKSASIQDTIDYAALLLNRCVDIWNWCDALPS